MKGSLLFFALRFDTDGRALPIAEVVSTAWGVTRHQFPLFKATWTKRISTLIPLIIFMNGGPRERTLFINIQIRYHDC